MSHYKALLRAIKYVIYTEYYFYQTKPYINNNGPWELHGYSDTDYAGDSNIWKSVTEYIF